jgi:hypothetical protein
VEAVEQHIPTLLLAHLMRVLAVLVQFKLFYSEYLK